MSFLSPNDSNNGNSKRNSFSGLPLQKSPLSETRSCDILFSPSLKETKNNHSLANLSLDAASKTKCPSMLRMPSVSQLLKLTLSPSSSNANDWQVPQAPQVVLNAYPVIAFSSECDIECQLCLNTVPHSQLYTLSECGCSFCRQCFQQYLTVNIKEGSVSLSCPNDKCNHNGFLNRKEIKELVTPEIFEQYQRHKLNREVSLDEERVWCPKVGCETICSISLGEPVQCSKCHYTFCPLCTSPWHSGICIQDSADEIVLDNEEIKSCPSCKVLIERNDGCAQMMCKYCEHIFCWHCLTSLDEDVFLKHFDKGPCKNKLGHSKASLMWHRARVAAFMAGLGLLILAVSPLLILAAPCLLCRCKQIRTLLQEDANLPPPENL